VIFGGILIASICWALTFGLPLGNFWLKIGLSVFIVSIYSFFFERPKIHFNPKSILWGFLSAFILYLIFLIGDKIAFFIISSSKGQVEKIYLMGIKTNKIFVFLLLLLITGPGEEIFWRGFLQRRLMERFGTMIGFILSTAIYGGVHIFSRNLILILAALVAGAFWGFLYLWKRDLLIQIISHSIWGGIIFVIAPVK
jgi:membrane protease YdiL (CAAX protease family)